jgi:hypothetical protein
MALVQPDQCRVTFPAAEVSAPSRRKAKRLLKGERRIRRGREARINGVRDLGQRIITGFGEHQSGAA